jgi:hypothetical protein
MLIRLLAKQLATYGVQLPKFAPYIPDFKRGIDHFCIHAGGRGVIDGIEKNLNLTPQHVEASRHALYTLVTFVLISCFSAYIAVHTFFPPDLI